MMENLAIVTLDDIKEVRLCWDSEYVLFPREVIRSFSYDLIKKVPVLGFCYVTSLVLEVDLKYVQKAYFWCGDEEGDRTIKDFIQSRNVWQLDVQLYDDTVLAIELPSYRKECYFGEKQYWNENVALNLCEHHLQKEDTLVIHWNYDKNDLYITDEEMPIFFQKKLFGIRSYDTNMMFGVKLFSMVLSLDERKKLLPKICEYWEKEDTILGCKKGYNFQIDYQQEEGLDICNIWGKNHSYLCKLTFILIPSWNEKVKKNIENILVKADENTQHFWSQFILVVNNDIDKDNLRKQVMHTKPLFLITYQKLNDYWWDAQSSMLY